jgi:peptide/nickel transport system ATP-binding protein
MDPHNRTKEAPISGDPPNPINPPSGCRFHTRCPYAEEICARMEPPLVAAGGGRRAACHMTAPAAAHSRAGEALQ